jgi:DNA-binding IclR family transcriptional regulator
VSRPALSATRAVDVLNFLAAHADESFTLSELVRRLDLNLASAHAVMAALEQAGYVIRHPSTRMYSLGPLLVALGDVARRRHPVLDVAEERLGELTAELDLEGLVVGAADTEMVILGRAGEPRPHGMKTGVGQRIPFVPPLGAVFLAWSAPDRVAEWMARAPSSAGPKGRKQYRDILEIVRARGFTVGLADPARPRMAAALDELEERPRSRAARGRLRATVDALTSADTVLTSIEPGTAHRVAHVAAPVFDQHHDVQLAVYLLGFRGLLSAERLLEIAHRLVETATLVTRLGGGRAPTR